MPLVKMPPHFGQVGFICEIHVLQSPLLLHFCIYYVLFPSLHPLPNPLLHNISILHLLSSSPPSTAPPPSLYIHSLYLAFLIFTSIHCPFPLTLHPLSLPGLPHLHLHPLPLPPHSTSTLFTWPSSPSPPSTAPSPSLYIHSLYLAFLTFTSIHCSFPLTLHPLCLPGLPHLHLHPLPLPPHSTSTLFTWPSSPSPPSTAPSPSLYIHSLYLAFLTFTSIHCPFPLTLHPLSLPGLPHLHLHPLPLPPHSTSTLFTWPSSPSPPSTYTQLFLHIYLFRYHFSVFLPFL